MTPALFVPACRWSTDTIDAARTTATQQGAGPGAITLAAGSQLDVRVTGEQDTALDVAVIQPGTQPRVVYRQQGEGAIEYRGWLGPRGLQTIERVCPAAANPYAIAIAVDARDGWAFVARGNTNDKCAVARRDPRTRAWTVGADVGVIPSVPAIWYDANARALRCLPSPAGRVFSSDDNGATWEAYSPRPLDAAPAGVVRCAAAWQPSGVLLLMADGANMLQYASTDGGVTFRRVNAANPSGYTAMGGCVALRDGGFGVWWATASGWFYRRISSATQPIDGSIGVATGATNPLIPSVCEDYDGTLLLYGSASSEIQCRASQDGGATWVDLGFCDYTGDGNVGVLAREVAGEIVVVGYTLGVDLPRTPLCWTFGGWSNLEFVRQSTATLIPGIPHSRLSAPGGRVWSRNTLPAGGWTGSGAGAVSLAGPGLTLTTTANSRGYVSADTGARALTSGSCDVAVVSGGSTSTPQIGIRQTKANDAGTLEREITICFVAAGFRVRDSVAGTEIAAVVVDCTEPVQVLWQLGQTGAWAVWWRRPADVGWQVAGAGAGLATRAFTAWDTMIWGNPQTGTAESLWRLATQEFGGSWGTGAALEYGRPVPLPTPIVEASSGALTWLAVGGVGTYTEVAQLGVSYTYGLDKLDPHRYPSRSIGWRSAVATEEAIVYDCGAATRPDGPLMGLIALGCDPLVIIVEASPDGTTWTTIASCSAPSIAGTAGHAGDTVTLTDGTDDRWWEHGALVGGVVYEAAAASRIVAATSGQARAIGGASVPLVLRRGTTDGTWPGSGTATAYAASRVHAWESPATPYRYWRIRWPALGGRPDGHTRIGTLALCDVYAYGGAASWGDQLGYTPRIDTAELPSGRRWARKAGPGQRRLTLGWTDGQFSDLVHRASSGEAAAVTVYGVPVAGQQDMAATVDGILAAAYDGAVPVVLARTLPDDEAAPLRLADDWCYGHIVTGVSRTYFAGDPGSETQAVRVDAITVEEAV